ncbi:MAG: hypothetical protein Q7R99_03420 [bacterium]|nr:hypothetical protein [bacterium]
MNDTFYIETNQIEGDPIIIPGMVSVSVFGQNFSSTVYTEKDNDMESLAFNYMEIPRLVDIEKEIRDYEERYKMKSDDFYKNWKTNPSFDNLDFNEWARLHKFLEYAKNN